MYEKGYQLPQQASVAWQVIRHPTATPREIINGTATDGVDITRFVQRISQSSQNVTLTLAWHMELYDPAQQPNYGEWISLRLNGNPVWNGFVQSLNDYGEQRSSEGSSRRMSVTVRSRDASPRWREARLVTNVYSMGTDLAHVARDILAFLDVSEDEYLLPSTLGVFTVHASMQMADVTAWDVLTAIGFPAGLEPFVDAIGRFKFVSRSTERTPTHTLTAGRLERVGGNRQKGRVSTFRVKWLDPNLTLSEQQEQALGHATITAGYFQLTQDQDVYWSSDRTQRASRTRLVIKQSCNNGLLPVASENYEQLSPTHGRITLKTQFWVPTLATASIAGLIATGKIGDFIGSTMTTTFGRRIQVASEAAILVVMMSMGTGMYEVWGVPFDYVHATNRTQAVDPSVPVWAEVVEEVENDFIMDEAQAQATAVRELLYRGLSASTYSLSLVDDTSIERGDILRLPDGSHLYVMDYSRDLQRGASHLLSVEGFLV